MRAAAAEGVQNKAEETPVQLLLPCLLRLGKPPRRGQAQHMSIGRLLRSAESACPPSVCGRPRG